MPNWLLKLICLVVAAGAAFAAYYFDTLWPYLITALALHRYYVIETLELVVIGTLASINNALFGGAEIDMADERDFIPEDNRVVLNSSLFRERLHRFDEGQ